MAGLIEWKNTERVLRELGESVRSNYQEQMRQHGHYTQKQETLINTIEVIVEREGVGSIGVSLSLNDYWKYLEYGTRPHWPPSGALLDWIETKPIVPYPSADGRIPTPEQLDYLIRRKIAQEGTQGTGDLGTATDLTMQEWQERLEDAIAQDIDQFTEAQIRLLI